MDNQFNENRFTITVNNNKYLVTAFCGDDGCNRFKIENACEYMFTLCINNEGRWEMEKDVTPLDESLIDDIGRAIEEQEAYN